MLIQRPTTSVTVPSFRSNLLHWNERRILQDNRRFSPMTGLVPCSHFHTNPGTALFSSSPSLVSNALVAGLSTPVVYRGYGLFSVLLSFVAGGLFFSTVLAALATVVALGRRNVMEGLAMIRHVMSKTLGLLW